MRFKRLLAFLVLACVAAGPVAVSSAASAAPSNDRVTRALRVSKPKLLPALKAKGIAWGAPVHLRIFKADALMELWMANSSGEYVLVKNYPICAFSGNLGPKTRVGDQQAPEGFYRITPGRMNPASSYHLSMNLGYPNALDRSLGRTGDYLMVHGNCVSIGCYAMTDAGIEEIYSVVNAAFEGGQTAVDVHAFPFRFTKNWRRSNPAPTDQRATWLPFWSNLADGDALFRATGRPPKVGVAGGRYTFAAST